MGGSIDEEVEEALTAIELSEKEGGVGLRVRGTYPFEGPSNGAVRRAAAAEDAATIAAEAHAERRMRMRCDFIVMMREVSGFRIERSCFGFPRIWQVWFCLVEQRRNEGPMLCYPTMNFVNQSVYDYDQIPTT
ncbi:hypothetical protein V8G54_012269 [Vigna mungo]|uniref:Uncharacterized protein n=1 Tax=Vigna mungo TaxID=3915 RepID=A0AAQ3S376_VIGMU